MNNRLLRTALLVTCAITWLIGEVMLWRKTRMADGEPALSHADVEAAFSRGYESLLQAFVENDMRPHLRNAEEVALLSAWARNGGGRAGYDGGVGALIEERCTGCHTRRGEASFRPLDSFEAAHAAALAPSAPGMTKQLLVTKVHIIGIGAMLAIIGAFFLSLRWPAETIKRSVVAGAFAGLFMDFGCWWLMRVHLSFSWGRVVGHTMMGCAFSVMCAAVAWNLVKKTRGVDAKD